MSTSIQSAAQEIAPQSTLGAAGRASDVDEELTDEIVMTLYAALETKTGDNLVTNSFKNDILADLIRRPDRPPDLGDRILRMYSDREHSDVWRSYCVQFFRIYYSSEWAAGDTSDLSDERVAFHEAYAEALTETDGHIAATALLGLERLSRDYAEFDRDEIARQALAFVSDDDVSDATRIAGMQVCGLAGEEEALPLARRLSQQTSSIPLRVASISTLGRLGGGDDIQILRRIQSENGVVNKAATQAIELFRQRH